MNKSIYSLVLSDEVVDAVDKLARNAGMSRSGMINRILAEKVAYITPEMRLQEILNSLARSINEDFMLSESTSGGMLSARTSLKYRYKPTVKYSVEIYSENGQRAGELKVSFRTQNAQLIADLTGFFTCWSELEKEYISGKLSNEIVMMIQNGRFTRTLNMPSDDVSDDDLGNAVAEYMEMLNGTMKEYFLRLPDTEQATQAAEEYYRKEIAKQEVII